MKDPMQNRDAGLNSSTLHSRKKLRLYFNESLKELYFAENAISEAFNKIQKRINSHKLQAILKNHYGIHLNHKDRLEKIFKMQNETAESKKCATMMALLGEAKKNFDLFCDDKDNWEIALILTAQKLAHYKIAAYGAVAHLAINLNDHRAATLLAIDVQEEEEFISNQLNGITHEFLSPYTE